ncbi:MAG: aminopeptidase [Candidatus Aenigmarchaeota archaeon]|nr:aminopeptidase [Candidatus Aenigmarchaeota archaeon]
MKPTGQHGKEPEKRIAEKMKKSDVVIALTTFSLTHTAAVRNAKKTRIASMPGFERKMMGAMLINYEKLKKDTMRLSGILEKGSIVKVITPSGTEAEFSIKGCKINPSYGIVEKDHVVNLPDGEVYLPPKSMNGVLVFDSYGKQIRKPTRLVIRNNSIADFEKSSSGNFMKKILPKKSDRFVAEFGVGTNSAARIIGNVLEDEKVLGTCHVAFGNNLGFGGTNRSSVHIDVIFHNPTIWADKKLIMKEGKPLW